MTKLYSVALNYQVWIDVEAKDEIDAVYYARNANFNLDLKQGENFGHMGSVTPVSKDIYQKYKQYGLPSGEAYIVLKGASHPTHNLLIQGEAERGFEVKKFGDRYFSVPKQKPKSSYDAIENGLTESEKTI